MEGPPPNRLHRRAQPGAMNCPAITTSTALLDLWFVRAAGTTSLVRAAEDG
jgi:hypothetical protein